ncbi:MAG: glycosyltransferase family 4 protein [Solirubrobacteraceae bacterium]
MSPRAPDSRAAGEVTIVAQHVGPVGGMERVLTELALGLRRRGYAVTIVAYECELPADSGVSFHRVRGPQRPFVLSYPWFVLFGSLVVARHRRGIVLSTGAILLNKVDLVGVHYCQQVGPATPSRDSWPFRLNAWASALLGRVAERVCFPRNDPRRFVCVSDGVAAEIRRYFPRFADRAITIPNGVDVDAFKPGARAAEAEELRSTLGIGAERLVAIFVGSEWQRKGLDAAIAALGGAAGWDLLVVGKGDVERYRALAARQGVGDAVHWIGVSRDVAPLYELADALVFPSSYEAFPLVALEAAAAGLPILATPVNGVRELVQDGVNGYLISRDAADIAARLEELAGDPALRARLGQAARRSALEYSWEKMVQRHQELYASITPRAGDS